MFEVLQVCMYSPLWTPGRPRASVEFGWRHKDSVPIHSHGVGSGRGLIFNTEFTRQRGGASAAVVSMVTPLAATMTTVICITLPTAVVAVTVGACSVLATVMVSMATTLPGEVELTASFKLSTIATGQILQLNVLPPSSQFQIGNRLAIGRA